MTFREEFEKALDFIQQRTYGLDEYCTGCKNKKKRYLHSESCKSSYEIWTSAEETLTLIQSELNKESKHE